MAEINPLRWEGPKMPRAGRIPTETWVKYEVIIREKYEIMSVDEMMSEIKDSYGFTATLELWGIQKRITSKNSPEAITTQSEKVHPNGETTGFSADEVPEDSKRRRSIESVDNPSDRSSGNNPSTHKNHRINSESVSHRKNLAMTNSEVSRSNTVRPGATQNAGGSGYSPDIISSTESSINPSPMQDGKISESTSSALIGYPNFLPTLAASTDITFKDMAKFFDLGFCFQTVTKPEVMHSKETTTRWKYILRKHCATWISSLAEDAKYWNRHISCLLINSNGLETLEIMADLDLMELYLRELLDRAVIVSEMRQDDPMTPP
ncbi:hypothetical protein SCUP234_11858 [Seiridium cupressi]